MSNNRPDDQQTYFRKRGIKTRLDAKEGTSFVGKSARTPFTEMAQRMLSRFTEEDTDVATLGEAYASGVYEQGTDGHRTYEDVYGKTDFTVPVQQDLATRDVLDEVFGNNDNDPTGERSGLSEDGVKITVSTTGTTKNALRNQIEIHRGLYLSQVDSAGIRDEETVGVRGVEDIGAAIEPIA